MERVFSAEETQAWRESLHRISSNAVVMLRNAEGQVLVVKANYKSYWNFPGGSVDEGETPKQAAIRELWEEVGVAVDPEELLFVAFVYQRTTGESYKLIFESPITQQQIENIKIQDSEIEDYCFVSKAQVREATDRSYAPAVMKWADDSLGGYDEQIS